MFAHRPIPIRETSAQEQKPPLNQWARAHAHWLALKARALKLAARIVLAASSPLFKYHRAEVRGELVRDARMSAAAAAVTIDLEPIGCECAEATQRGPEETRAALEATRSHLGSNLDLLTSLRCADAKSKSLSPNVSLE